MPRGKKKAEKVEEVRSEVEEVMESTATVKTTEAEQQVIKEQVQQKRIADCTAAVQKALQEHNCDFDITVLLRAGQVIPRIAIMPIEILQAQRNPQSPPV